MTLLAALLLFIAGVVLLVAGAWALVGGGARLARLLGVSSLVVGLTVVAWGTSAPELVVSLVAALRGSSDLMLGNVIGSNLANIGLILGVAALMLPPGFGPGLWRFEIPALLIGTGVFAALCLDGALGRGDGLLLMALFAIFTLWTFRRAREDGARRGGAGPDADGRGIMISTLLVLGGCAGLVGGSHLIVESATEIARRFGVTEMVIGVSLVAVGTSLPELATTVAAALRRDSGIALGNIVGSNLFNLLAVAGPAAALRPVGDTTGLFGRHLPGLMAVTIALPLLMLGRSRIGRVAGVVLLSLYAGLLVWWMGLLP